MANQPVNSSETVLLRNARIVLPDHVTEPGSILIDGDRIERIFDAGSAPSSPDDSIDLAGLTLFPGFIDVHIHGAVGVDTMEASSEGLLQIAEFLATQGVTGWLPTLVPASVDQYRQAISSIEKAVAQTSVRADRGDRKIKSVLRAQALGVHYEGPFVNREQCGALHGEHFRTFKGVSDLDDLPLASYPGAVHMMTLAPEVFGGIDLIKELSRRSWITSIGHTRAPMATLDHAREAGARHMTHFMNAMSPLHHRAPGPVGWGLIDDRVTVDLIADGFHLDPAAIKLIVRCKGAERISLISDAIAAAGKGDGNYEVWGETIVVKGGQTQNGHGSIAGSVITMLDAFRLMRSLEVSEIEVARMAATNPAQLLGLSDRGSIEIGKRADLVALDAELNVKATVVGGVLAQY
jgi:N-acetylglucosamine-6-phosphate deacetylase